MNLRTATKVFLLLWLATPPPAATAQGVRGGPPPNAKAAAPIDLTGYWTAVITEDWHVRMLTAPRGDFGVGAPGAVSTTGPGSHPLGLGPNPSEDGDIPYKPAAAKLALGWDPAKDEREGNQCQANGAP